MSDKGRVERLVAAGGVVYRRQERGQVEVVLCGRLTPLVWSLPKGTPDPGETLEETALREVHEETGLRVVLERAVKSISYWFVRPSDNVRCFKRVSYYRMHAVGGSTAEHDREFDVVQWFPVEAALSLMTYPSERQVVTKAMELLHHSEEET